MTTKKVSIKDNNLSNIVVVTIIGIWLSTFGKKKCYLQRVLIGRRFYLAKSL